MVFRAGLCGPCTRDVARLRKDAATGECSVYAFLKSKVEQQHQSMVHAVLHGKTFGNCKITSVNLNFPCRIV